MPFTNEVIGTNGVLIRNWMQSENFVSGVSGWQITKSGNAEFSTGTFRGSIESGPLTGQHFIVNNPTTGDPLDIYNSSNQLIFSINAFGVAESHNPATGISSGLQTGNLEINDGTGNNDTSIILVPASSIHTQSVTEIACSPPIGTTYVLNLYGGSDDGNLGATLVGNERNIQGSIVQTDQRSTNNLFHGASYNVTTNAAGHAIFNHGCVFTPKGGVVTGTAPGGTFANLTCGIDGLTASQADVNWTIANTGAAWANSVITFDMLLWG